MLTIYGKLDCILNQGILVNTCLVVAPEKPEDPFQF